MPVIFLDDVMISEENNGFSVEDFIGYVKKDTTFYMGFKHLRFYPHNYRSELNIFDKKGKTIGTLKKQGRHYSDGQKAMSWIGQREFWLWRGFWVAAGLQMFFDSDEYKSLKNSDKICLGYENIEKNDLSLDNPEVVIQMHDLLAVHNELKNECWKEYLKKDINNILIGAN